MDKNTFTGWISSFILEAIVSVLCTFVAGNAYAQDTFMVTGTVTDEDNEPLPGVSVYVRNTLTGTSTDEKGNFILEIPSGSEELVFSCLGYLTQTRKITNSRKYDIALQQEEQYLDEIIVVGYGVQKKESSVAAITQVKGNKLADMGMTSISNAMAGQIPGVSVMQSNGQPGEDATTINIRGVSSWVSSAPLVLVDGVERDYNNIDPNEIETISVLKDASATAVFGVRGANGVILITTKRGKAGKVNVSWTSDVGIVSPINMVSPMDSYETGLVMNEARKNDNDWGALLSDEVLEHYRVQDMPYIYPDTDWQDLMLKNGVQHKHNINVSGGTDFARVYASLSYLHEGSVIRTIKNDMYDPSYKYDRYNYRFNVDMNVTKTTLVSVDAGGYIGFKNRPYEEDKQRLFRPIYTLGPMDGVPFYPESVLDEYPDHVRPDETGVRIGTTDLTQAENPMVANSFSGSSTVKTSNINISVKLQQKLDFITEGLSAKLLVAYNNTTRWIKFMSYSKDTYKLLQDGTWLRRLGRDEEGREDPVTRPYVTSDNMDMEPYPLKNYYYEFSVDYNRTFGKHTVTGLVVGQRRKTVRNIQFPSYEQGIAARVTYDYANRYLFETNVSYNGSEQFAPDNQYGLFPSFAIGYNIHNEKFFRPLKKVINRAKIRASWGQVGSDMAGSERWLFTSSFINGSGWNYTPGLPNAPGPSRVPVIEEKAANINARWEVATKKDIGVELSFLKNDMFVLTMDFFDEFRDGILLSRQSVPTYVGTQPKMMNIGQTRTKGYEIELLFQYTSRDRNWHVWAKPAISFSDNRIITKDEPENTPAYMKEAGHRIGQIFGYHHTGWIQDADVAMTSARYGGGLMGLGDTEYVDFNGDGIIDTNDMYALGYSSTYPLYNYSLSLGFNYKNFGIDILVQGVSHISKILVDNFAWPLHKISSQVFDYQLDAWSPSNRDSRFPALHFDANRAHNAISDTAPKSVNVFDASYIRLKNVNIYYTVPERITSKIGVSDLKFYLRGNNLFTFAPWYPLADPEGSDSNGSLINGFYPLTRTVSFGFQVNF